MNQPIEVSMIGDFTRNLPRSGQIAGAGLRPAPTRRTALAAAVWACLAFVVSGEARAVEVQPLNSQKVGWQLLPQYSDEFDDVTLDVVKWDNDVKDWGVWSWEPGNASVFNGQLSLRMDYSEHKRGWQTLFYKSGIVKSKAPPIRYGYFEARIKAASRYPGVGPAFWGYRQDAGEWTEIDFVELTQRRLDVKIVDTNTHVFAQALFPGKLPLQELRSWIAPWDPRDDFHVYGCEWDAKQIKWYVDGILIQTMSNDYWHQALDIVLSLGVRADLKTQASPLGFPTTALVDYIRVWSSPN